MSLTSLTGVSTSTFHGISQFSLVLLYFVHISFRPVFSAKRKPHTFPPMLHRPCGPSVQRSAALKMNDNEKLHHLGITLEATRLQLNITIAYIEATLPDVYKKLREEGGLTAEYYNRDCVPSSDQEWFRQLSKLKKKQLIKKTLKRFLDNLKVYAASIYMIWEDMKQRNDDKSDEIEAITHHIKMLMCEVQTAYGKNHKTKPKFCFKKFDVTDENNTVRRDVTSQTIFDNGVLVQYEEFLREWIAILKEISPSSSSQRGPNDTTR